MESINSATTTIKEIPFYVQKDIPPKVGVITVSHLLRKTLQKKRDGQLLKKVENITAF